MNKYIERTITIIIGFCVTFGLNLGLGVVTSSRGFIEIDELIDAGNPTWAIRITNAKSQTINGLLLRVSKGVSVDSVRSNHRIDIRVKDRRVDHDVLELSLIPGLEATNILIRTSTRTALTPSAPNAADLDLLVKASSDVEGVVASSVRQALITSGVYLVFLFGLLLYMAIQRESFRLRQEELKEELKSIGEELEKIETSSKSEQRRLRGDLDATKKQAIEDFKSLRTQYSFRMRDYQREVDFWRDAVRRTLYAVGTHRGEADTFLLAITRALGTYSTQVQERDLATVDAMAKLYARELSVQQSVAPDGPGPASAEED